MNENIYNENFHKDRDTVTRKTANIVLNILKDIYNPSSLIDLGGGIGVWVSEFISVNGNESVDAVCYDGDYISEDMLVIQKDNFVKCNLEERINVQKKYDLAMSLEVAEHLSKERAKSFVNDLTNMSDCIMFSAAIIGQGGEGHINEQYMSYWVELFKENGFVPYDVVRPFIQDIDEVPWWYKQNIMVYVNKKRNDLVQKFDNIKTPPLLHMVYDIHYNGYFERCNSKKSLRQRIKNILK